MRYSCCAVIDNIVDGMIIIIIHACVDLFIYTSILLLYKIFSDVASGNEFMNQQHQQQPMTFSFTHTPTGCWITLFDGTTLLKFRSIGCVTDEHFIRLSLHTSPIFILLAFGTYLHVSDVKAFDLILRYRGCV